jgi:predicted MPP superfamily phosphohydrolase
MLAHRNDMMTLWAPTKTDLVLAGHGHGGVIRLPYVGGLLSVNRTFFPKDAEGLRTQDRTTVAVTRGVGGVRLWNRPHIPTIVLKKQ